MHRREDTLLPRPCCHDEVCKELLWKVFEKDSDPRAMTLQSGPEREAQLSLVQHSCGATLAVAKATCKKNVSAINGLTQCLYLRALYICREANEL